MTPLSGSPNKFTVIHIGKVKARAIPVKHHAAKNFPATASHMVTGSVIRSSMVPDFRSSAHSRMANAGISTKYNQGWKSKKGMRSACPLGKKFPK